MSRKRIPMKGLTTVMNTSQILYKMRNKNDSYCESYLPSCLSTSYRIKSRMISRMADNFHMLCTFRSAGLKQACPDNLQGHNPSLFPLRDTGNFNPRNGTESILSTLNWTLLKFTLIITNNN